VDTISIRGEKAFKIRYQPKRTEVLAFQGYLYIDTDTYAVLGAILKSTQKINVNFINGISTELEYDNPTKTHSYPENCHGNEMTPFSKKKTSKALLPKDLLIIRNINLINLLKTKYLREKKRNMMINLLIKMMPIG
jgi:hypothetical protein